MSAHPFPPFEDSRRLTGPSLHFAVPGVVLETLGAIPGEAALAGWRRRVLEACAALGWPAPQVDVRLHARGAELALTAPFDQLLCATEVNEWAWLASLRETGGDAGEAFHAPAFPAAWDQAQALRTLERMAAAERRPGLLALIDQARRHGLRVLADDECLSIGSGAGVVQWPLDALPSPGEVDWPALHDVPAVLVTGSNGKTTTTRLLAAMLRADRLRAGFSSTDGLVVDGRRIDSGDYSGPVGARTVLRHPRVQAAVLETARGGLLRRGLVIGDARVAVVTNVSADHFGEYGIHDLDDLAMAKLVVARGLAPDGLLVLNAADPALLRHVPAGMRIGWFAPAFADAIARGAPACGVRDGRLVLAVDGIEHELGAIASMPLTLAGRADYNIANIAAASLAASALGIAPATIAGVLAWFGSNHADNPGRLQRWRFGGDAEALDVVLDYAHNPDGLRGLLRAVDARGRRGRMGIVLGHAGNRLDEDIRALGEAAMQAGPERVWLKDIRGGYLRGRAEGEIASILSAALRDQGLPADAIEVQLDEVAAARAALGWARAGDLLVLPIHEPAARDAVVALLDGLHARGWSAGQALE